MALSVVKFSSCATPESDRRPGRRSVRARHRSARSEPCGKSMLCPVLARVVTLPHSPASGHARQQSSGQARGTTTSKAAHVLRLAAVCSGGHSFHEARGRGEVPRTEESALAFVVGRTLKYGLWARSRKRRQYLLGTVLGDTSVAWVNHKCMICWNARQLVFQPIAPISSRSTRRPQDVSAASTPDTRV